MSAVFVRLEGRRIADAAYHVSRVTKAGNEVTADCLVMIALAEMRARHRITLEESMMEKKTVYVTTDGHEFADKAEAAQHEAGGGLAAYLKRVWPGAPHNTMSLQEIEIAIRSDVEGLRDAIKQLLPRRARAKLADAGKPRAGHRKAKASADGNGARAAV